MSSVPPINEEIAQHLGELARIYESKRDEHRRKVYANASVSIGGSSLEVTSGSFAARTFAGIGPSISKDIDEFLASRAQPPYVGMTSRMISLAPERAKQATIDLFKDIYGVGPVTANEWYDQGYRSLNDLINGIQTPFGPVRPNLTDGQRLGLLYYYHFKQRIPRPEMDLIRATIQNIWNASFPGLTWEIAGSYRRGEASSGDIDIIVLKQYIPSLRRSIHINDLVMALQNAGIITGHLGAGDYKYLGILRLSNEYNAHRLDIILAEPVAWASSLLYFTGSDKHNVLMRMHAKEMGYSLDEHGLRLDNGLLFDAATEGDIYRALGKQYLSPEQRTRDIQYLPDLPR